MNRLAAFLVTLSRQLFWVAAFGLILACLLYTSDAADE